MFNKLLFGITCAPEIFQRRMSQIVSGLPGVVCLLDDVLVFGSTEKEHNTRLHEVLRRLERAKVTLNKDKCLFKQTSITFLGHVVDAHGISADPRKTAVIRAMPSPTNLTELHWFLRMTNHLDKFSLKLAELSQPLRELLSQRNTCTWHWDKQQQTPYINPSY